MCVFWGLWMKKNIVFDIFIYCDDVLENLIVVDVCKKVLFMVVLGGKYSYLVKLNGNMFNGV